MQDGTGIHYVTRTSPLCAHHVATILLAASLLIISGCSSIVSTTSSRLADTISRGLLTQDDPEIARLGTPAYLVLIDGFIENDPTDANMLSAGAELYNAYAGAFVKEPERSKRLTQKSFDYGRRALCLRQSNTCDMDRQPHQKFVSILKTIDPGHVDTLYAYALSWIGWIQAHRDNLGAVADLPKAQSALEHVLALNEGYREGGAHLYLGVIHSLIPPALGGKPELARTHFERALELSEGRNQMVRVLYAEHYARLLFNRELHDELLNIVLKVDPHQPGYTLSNVLAQARAKALLDSADDFF